MTRNTFVVFGLFHNNVNVNTFNFDNHIVEYVKQVRYLGFVIDERLFWKFHINSIHNKVFKGLGMLKMCYLYFPKDCLLTVCNSFTLPYLQYGIEFWDSSYTTYLHPLRII